MRYLLPLILAVIYWAPAYAQQTGYAPSDGVAIYYETYGEGAPIVLINGGPGFSSEGFRTLAGKVADMGYSVTIFDQRGTGRSPLSAVNESTVTMQLMAGDMESLRETLGFEQWTLYGHSFGGMLANFYAARYPERVRAIIHSSSGGLDLALLGSSAELINRNLEPAEIDSLDRWRRLRRIPGRETEVEEKYANTLAKAYVFDQSKVAEVAERLQQGDRALNRLVWANLRRIRFNEKAALASFPAPVLIIQGKQDIIPEQLALTADRIFLNAEVLFLDRCAHYGWLDRPEAYFRAVDKFLTRVHG